MGLLPIACPLKRQTDTCHGIATYCMPTRCAHSRGILILALGYRDPTQEANWCLLWDCYLNRTPTPCADAYWYLLWDCYLSHAHSLCPLKRHTDSCPGISRSHSRGILILAVGLLPITRPLIVPTQMTYWYLLFDCYLSHTYSLCPLKRHTDTCPGPGISRSHSRGILILAVRLLLKSHTHSLCPLKRHTNTFRRIATYIARPLKRHTDTWRGTAT